MGVLVGLVVSVLIVVGTVVVWGLLEPYSLERRTFEVGIPELPEAWEGKRVALLADLQVGMWWHNTPTIRRAVAEVIRERPDLVLIAGDFIYDTRDAVAPVVRLLEPLTDAGLRVYAVLGNHDYAVPDEDGTADEALARELCVALEAISIRVLQNVAVPLRMSGAPGEPPLYLLGVGSYTTGHDDPAGTLAQAPAGAVKIALMHHPKSFDGFPAHTVPLAMAGHTHGGQVRLPFLPLWSYLTYTRQEGIFTAGWVHDGAIEGYGQPGNHLYINRGIGFSVIPLRVGCPPELTLFTLRRGPPTFQRVEARKVAKA